MVLHQRYGFRTRSLYEEEPPLEMASILGGGGQVDDLSAAAASPERWYVKTHEPASEDAFPAIHVVRDGRDALVSYARYIHQWPDTNPAPPEVVAATLHALVAQDRWFGGWSANVSSWINRPDTVLINFELLITDPHLVVHGALSALGLEAPATDNNGTPTFAQLHAMLPSFFTRGEVGRWRKEMPADVEELFWQRHGPLMQRLGYVR